MAEPQAQAPGPAEEKGPALPLWRILLNVGMFLAVVAVVMYIGWWILSFAWALIAYVFGWLWGLVGGTVGWVKVLVWDTAIMDRTPPWEKPRNVEPEEELYFDLNYDILYLMLYGWLMWTLQEMASELEPVGLAWLADPTATPARTGQYNHWLLRFGSPRPKPARDKRKQSAAQKARSGRS